MTERRLDRAGKLVSGLAGERERWIVTVEVGGAGPEVDSERGQVRTNMDDTCTDNAV